MLAGSGVRAVVRIACGKDVKEIRLRKGTSLRPCFNQMVFFDFIECTEDMLERTVEIKVLVARRVIADALIGSYTVREKPLLVTH